MDENKNNGELFGFDSNENTSEKSGYTVTPDGGFYDSVKKPDEPSEPEESTGGSEQADAAHDEPPVNVSFNNNGSYSGSGYNSDVNEFVFKTAPAPKPPRPPKAPKERKGISFAALIASVLIAAIVGASFGAGFFALSDHLSDSRNSSNTGTSSGTQNNVSINVENVDATVVEAVASKVTPSVVGIRTTVSVYNFFYGEQESSGEGSGVIYSEDGYIITNYHVIQEAVENSGSTSEILVFLTAEDEEGHPATVVGYNVSHDLAVIKINASGLTPVTFADSSKLNVGQFVVAIGNPGGLQFMGSVTYGVISGLNRVLSDSASGTAVELIQTDAAINPGNSGGALVNVSGELVGINSSKLVSESYEGMGFAIPANTTKDICDKIIAKEYDPDPYIGITISEKYDAETLRKYNFPVGAVVYSVVSGSPADDAGIKSGDIITEFNGVEITNYTVLGDVLSDCKPGQTVSLKVYRSNRSYSANITIGSNNSQ